MSLTVTNASNFKELLCKPETWAMIGAVVAIAAAVALIVLGVQHIHVSQADTYYYDREWGWMYQGNCSILNTSEIGKAVGFLCGGGVAFGGGLFAIRHFLVKKISEVLETEKKSLSDKAVSTVRGVQAVLSLIALAAAVTICVISMNYLFSQPPALGNYGHAIGSYCWQTGVIRACIGVAGAGALGAVGLAELFSMLSKYIGKEKVVIIKPTNDFEDF